MNYYKNVELAKMYTISEKTVSRWLDLSEKGKLELDLIKEEKRAYIANTPTNHVIIKNLINDGKKYRNSITLKEIKPQQELFDIYSDGQIIDIISNLEIYKEIPHKYIYFKTGADYWNDYINRVIKEKAPITIKYSIESLQLDQEYIYSLIKKYKNINIVDIGAGNGEPMKNVIRFLLEKKLLRKYIAIDISPDMLRIAECNLRREFGRDLAIETYEKDITKDSIQEILFANSQTDNENNSQNTINLVFFIGTTIENQKNYEASLNVIKESLGKYDLFILGQLLDTERNKIHLSFSSKDRVKQNSDLGARTLILDLLNITSDLYEIDRFYDVKQKARIIAASLKNDIRLVLKGRTINKTLNFHRKDKIIIYRHNHHTDKEVIDAMYNVGFEIKNMTISDDGEHVLLIAKKKSNFIF